MTYLADARAASLAEAGMAFPADLAGIVTVGMTYLADAGAASLVDPAGGVAGGVTDLSVPAPMENEEMPLLQGFLMIRSVVMVRWYVGVMCQFLVSGDASDSE